MTGASARIACFFGMHEYIEETPKMNGRLVLVVKECRHCGVRKGTVEKL